MQLFRKAVPVWSIPENEVSDQYRLFRRKFTVSDITQPIFLDIAADTTFCVFINGNRLPIQQLADFKADITVSRYDITSLLKCGENIIACEVHFVGEDFFTCFAGTAFLCLEIHDGKHIFTATDESWKWLVSPDMHNGLNCKVSLQLGFVFCKDFRKSIPYEQIDFDDSDWQNTVKAANCGNWKMSLRKVPQLVELSLPDTQCVPQMGYLRREKEETTFALTAFHDYLTPRTPVEFFDFSDSKTVNRMWHKKGEDLSFKTLPDGADGYYILIDTGRERVGYPVLDITAPAGTVIDFSHGEHLEAGRVSSYIGTRNFTDRVITREGRNRLCYTHRRLGLRYIELHITNCAKGKIILHYAGVTPLELPLPEQSFFDCGDRVIQELNQLSYETLKLCMHEHYEDCPWREQSLYAYDSRNQMLYGYYIWGNYEFARVSLDLLGTSFDGKDYIGLIAPGDCELTIPIFTMVWVSAVYEHHLFSGNSELTEKYLGVIDKIIDSAFSRTIEGVENLYHTGSGSRIWNFCEWNGSLSRVDGHPQSTYNTYLYEAAVSAAKLHKLQGHSVRAEYLFERAEKLKKAINERFYDNEKECYTVTSGEVSLEDDDVPEHLKCFGTGSDDTREYEHIQQIMLANEIAPIECVENIVNAVLNEKFNPIDLSAYPYLISGMMKSGYKARTLLTRRMTTAFDAMLFSGATSLWETQKVFDKFDGGSLCHAWSSVMPYFCGRCILGVTPLEPGFSKFEVKPYSAGLPEASGSVPSPHGFIYVSWTRTESGMKVEIRHPKDLECTTASYPECGNVTFEIEQY